MLVIESAGITDVGKKREGNEDALYLDDDLGLYVVADGMGGHQAGEVASGLVVETIRDYIKRIHEDQDAEELEDSDETLSKQANQLLSGIHLANRGVH
jgi:protein phosphatase